MRSLEVVNENAKAESKACMGRLRDEEGLNGELKEKLAALEVEV